MAKFATVRRGYDIKEVESFCTATEFGFRRELSAAEKKINALTEENKKLKEELEAAKRREADKEFAANSDTALVRCAIVNERINAVWLKLERKLKETDNRTTIDAIAEAEGFFIGAKVRLGEILKEEYGIDLGCDGPDGDEVFERIRRDAVYRWLKDD